MGDIYIKTDGNRRVTAIHYNPFDPVQGTGETREEMEKTGFFVDEVPEPNNITGRRAIAMYNPDTRKIYYEYVGIPLSDKERLDLIENTMNEILVGVSNIIGIGVALEPAKLISLDGETESLSVGEAGEQANIEFSDEQLESLKNTAKYIAHQIISGNMELEFAYKNFPNIAGIIKDELQANGIQG